MRTYIRLTIDADQREGQPVSRFKLTINADAESLSNRYDEERPSLATEQVNRQKSVAELLRVAALMTS